MQDRIDSRTRQRMRFGGRQARDHAGVQQRIVYGTMGRRIMEQLLNGVRPRNADTVGRVHGRRDDCRRLHVLGRGHQTRDVSGV